MPKKVIEKHEPVRQFKRTVLDRCNVVSGLAVDLGEALRTGKVPTKVGPSDVSYNGIENPANILSRPSDVFDAMQMEQAALKLGTKKTETPAPAAEPQPAPASSQE